jgi:hypothetical protein
MVGARTGEKGAHGKEGRARPRGCARQWGRARGCARQRGIARGARPARGALTEKGPCTAKGRVRQGWVALGGRARPSGTYVCVPNGGRGLRHVDGVGAYARAHHWGANGGHARLQGGAYICFALLI